MAKKNNIGKTSHNVLKQYDPSALSNKLSYSFIGWFCGIGVTAISFFIIFIVQMVIKLIFKNDDPWFFKMFANAGMIIVWISMAISPAMILFSNKKYKILGIIQIITFIVIAIVGLAAFAIVTMADTLKNYDFFKEIVDFGIFSKSLGIFNISFFCIMFILGILAFLNSNKQ